MLPYFSKIKPLLDALSSLSILSNNEDITLNIEHPSQFDLLKNENYERICIFGDKICTIPNITSIVTGSIKYLSIESTNIMEIPVFTDHNFTDIRIYNNKELKRLAVDPSNFRSLKTLNLSNNRLMLLDLKCDGTSNLEELDLSNNRLTFIPDQFTKFPDLKRLNLKNNRLKYLPGTIRQLKSLEMIDLEGNPLEAYSPLKGTSIGWIDIVKEFKKKAILGGDGGTRERIAELVESHPDGWNFGVISRINTSRLDLVDDFEWLIIKSLITVNNRNQIDKKLVDELVQRIEKDSEGSFEDIYNSLLTAIYMRIYKLRNQDETEGCHKDIVLDIKTAKYDSIYILRNIFDRISPVDPRNIDLMQFILNNGTTKHTRQEYHRSTISPDALSVYFISFICKSLTVFKNTCLSQLVVVFETNIEEFCVFEYYKHILEKYIGFNSLFDGRMENIITRYRKSEHDFLRCFLECFQVQKFINILIASINSDRKILNSCKAFVLAYCKDMKPVSTTVTDKEIKKILRRLRITV